MTPGERTECAAVLRAVADLVEAGEATGDLDADVSFWLTRVPDQSAAARIIAGALPLRWSGAPSPSIHGDYYNLTAATAGAGSINGVRIAVRANAGAVATEAGTRSITEWAPSPEIAALLDQDPEVTP